MTSGSACNAHALRHRPRDKGLQSLIPDGSAAKMGSQMQQGIPAIANREQIAVDVAPRAVGVPDGHAPKRAAAFGAFDHSAGKDRAWHGAIVLPFLPRVD